MKVLVGFEFSGRVRDAFLAKGHEAYSCDLLDTTSPGPHLIGDFFQIFHEYYPWDLVIAHPPCTHLCLSGNAWWSNTEERQKALHQIWRIVRLCQSVPRLAFENPIGVISSHITQPDQIVEPYWFGDAWVKATCLWLWNLPPLKVTNRVEPVIDHHDHSPERFSGLPRGLWRSITPRGMAEAMADQWGSMPA